MPKATPMATDILRLLALIAPPETSSAFIATAISEGSAIVVLKPIEAAKI